MFRASQNPMDSECVQKMTAPTLLDLPGNVLAQIAGKSGFFAILNLRKVCSKLRTLLNEYHPNAPCEKIHINLHSRFIYLTYIDGRSTEEERKITYEKRGNNYSRSRSSFLRRFLKRQVIKMDFVDLFCQDFQLNLHYQKSPLSSLTFDWQGYLTGLPKGYLTSSILDKLTEIWSNRNQKLKVKSLELIVKTMPQITSTLPFMDPRILEVIKVRSLSFQVSVDEIYELSRLEQWSSVDTVRFGTITNSSCFNKLFHLNEVDVDVGTLYLRDAVMVKEVFRTSPNKPSAFSIRYGIFPYGNDFPRYLGLIENEVYTNEVWYFRIAENAVVLLRIYFFGCILKFSRVEMNAVPENALIRLLP